MLSKEVTLNFVCGIKFLLQKPWGCCRRPSVTRLYQIQEHSSGIKWGAQSERKVNIVVTEKWNIKTVGAKGRQIFFSGKAKQNKVGAEERQIFFSGRAKQNKVGGKEWLGCLAFAPTLKQQIFILFRFPLAPFVFMFHFSMITIFTRSRSMKPEFPYRWCLPSV